WWGSPGRSPAARSPKRPRSNRPRSRRASRSAESRKERRGRSSRSSPAPSRRAKSSSTERRADRAHHGPLSAKPTDGGGGIRRRPARAVRLPTADESVGDPIELREGPRRNRARGSAMVSAEEIGAVQILGSLGLEERERLSRAAADIQLVTGEFAVNEGDERALFGVLEGRIEVVRVIDGIERVIGERNPGDVFGEVPLTLGTGFPGAYRATEPTRVMRLDVNTYNATVALAPDLGVQVAALAGRRIGGLQGIAAEPPPPRAIVVGHRWDPDCTTLRQFLDRNQVSFKWLIPDDAEAEGEWGERLPGEEDCPTVRVIDGKTVVRPQLRRVAELLGLPTQSEHADYDTVIVGAGPSGLAAAVYGASEGLRTIVIER